MTRGACGLGWIYAFSMPAFIVHDQCDGWLNSPSLIMMTPNIRNKGQLMSHYFHMNNLSPYADKTTSWNLEISTIPDQHVSLTWE